MGWEKKNLPGSRLELKAEIPADKFMSYWPRAWKGLAAKVSFPGFRPGQAPEKLVLERLGEAAVLQEAAEMAISEAYLEIIKAEQIDALGRPEVAITKLAKDNPLTFTLITDIYPAVKLPDYKKLAGDIARQDLKMAETSVEKDKHRLKMIQAIIDQMALEIPAVMINLELDKMLAEFKDEITRLGLVWSDYLKHLKKSEVELKVDWRDQALERIKFGLVFHEIAKAEKLRDQAAVWDRLEKNWEKD